MAQYKYTLGAAGERTAVKELNRTVEYTYDALYRLTSEKIAAADGTVTAYTNAYDNVSNRILKTENGADTVYTYNALNQLTAENDITYEYDAAGNLISAASTTKSTLYVYNAENKLIRATVQEGDEVSVEEYEYDYAGNRTVKKSEGEYTYYLNDISGSLTQVLAEIDADGNEKCWYTRGIELISQERSGLVSYYLTDGHGSVRQLADIVGTVTDTYVYDAWGNLISSTGETENSYLYCGEQLDSTTGLYYLRARYMNPTTGTFITQDTYAGTIFDPTSLHKYLYANANPVSFCDPSGYLGVLSLGMGSMGAAAIDEGSTLNYVAIYHSLVNLIRGAVATYGATRILATVMLPFAAYMGGKIAQSYSNVLINSALEVVTKYGKSIVIASALNIAVSTFIQHALDWIKSNNITNNRYNNAMAKHHIVPKGMDSTFMSRIILSSVGINCYTKSTLSPNIVVIKYSTHYAIHSNNDAYCAFVNSVILSAYCASASSGYAQQVVAVHAALFSLRTIIRGLDNIIP